jgi:hypothetical protein
MGSADDGAQEEALESARRVYDRQLNKLDSIDDTALRTVRTSVIILGFIAAALTAGGPAAASDLNLIPVVLGALGTLCVFSTAFISIGTYAIGAYPTEVTRDDLKRASDTPRDEWLTDATSSVARSSGQLSSISHQKQLYLDLGLGLLLLGAGLLLFSAAISVLNRSYGIAPPTVVGVVVGLSTPAIVIRLILTRRQS